MGDDTGVLSHGSGGWTTNPTGVVEAGALISLKADGTGTLCGVVTPVIHWLDVRWQVVPGGRLRLTHLGTPQWILPPNPASDEPQFYSHRPSGELTREVGFTLTPVRTTVRVPTTGKTVAFRYTLELGQSPWPPDLGVLRDVPRRFFGHPQVIAEGPDAEPGAAPDRRGM